MIPKNSEIRFEVTTNCNYNCTICCRRALMRRLELMSLETFKFLLDRITNETDQYSACTFSGFGEPMLDPTLIQKIEYATKRGMKALILTNASLLTMEKFRQFNDLGVISIRVSFYGNSPTVYNKIHGIEDPYAFNNIKNTLTEICRARRNTKILLTYNVEKGVNEDDEKQWIEYWKDKADLIEVWRPHNWVYGKEYRKVQDKLVPTCGRPFKGPLQIQVDGTVNMCCFDFNGKLTLGDLKSQTLREIFDSPIYKKIVHCHTTGDFESSGLICEKCDQRNMDKSNVMIYNSKFDITERVKRVSTTYQEIVE
ncbi:MAG: SPASM domain-containing protein [Candidatus Omnitrophica bacterium]|nr:SPASM domain-containing protein [Candidatus Omnitrophota bacterium]MCM8790593.1 SPASM domain-containing protein [Candidatus Omnitrophota bacterium]